MRVLETLYVDCPGCGHRLMSQVVRDGSFFFVLYLEDGDTLETCPRCGTALDGNALKSGNLIGEG